MWTPEKIVECPARFHERDCLLVRYRLPGLPHCFALCARSTMTAEKESALMLFFLEEARHLAASSVGDAQAFLWTMGGASIRARQAPHVHVFVVQTRWQKALAYVFLALRNVSKALFGDHRSTKKIP